MQKIFYEKNKNKKKIKKNKEKQNTFCIAIFDFGVPSTMTKKWYKWSTHSVQVWPIFVVEVFDLEKNNKKVFSSQMPLSKYGWSNQT